MLDSNLSFSELPNAGIISVKIFVEVRNCAVTVYEKALPPRCRFLQRFVLSASQLPHYCNNTQARR